MALWIAIAICLIMAILSITGKWKANKFGVAGLWMLVALQSIFLIGLIESYKDVVLMLNK